MLKIVAVTAVIIAVAAAAVYIMLQFEQTKPIAEAALALPNQAVDVIQKNGIISTTAITGGITALSGVALSKIQSSAAKKVEEIKTQASTEVSKATETMQQEKTTLLSQVKEQADATKQGYETQIADLKKQLEDSTVDVNAVNGLKQQLQGAQDMHNNFVAQLTSGSQQVIDPATNQVYKLITLEKTIVK